MAITKTPHTYQEWMVCLASLKQERISAEDISVLKNGSLNGGEHLMGSFETRLQDTVNFLLKKITGRYTRTINLILEEGNPYDLESVLIRFPREISVCRFYRELYFLPGSFATELDQQVVGEIQRYWKELYKTLEQIAETAGSEEMEDVLYQLRRVRLPREEA